MLMTYANYAPQITHYATECHYASKQNNFLGHKNTFSHRTVIKHIALVLLKLSEASCGKSCARISDKLLLSHVETAHAQYARG